MQPLQDTLFQCCVENDVPKDMKDAKIVRLFRNKQLPQRGRNLLFVARAILECFQQFDLLSQNGFFYIFQVCPLKRRSMFTSVREGIKAILHCRSNMLELFSYKNGLKQTTWSCSNPRCHLSFFCWNFSIPSNVVYMSTDQTADSTTSQHSEQKPRCPRLPSEVCALPVMQLVLTLLTF